MTGSDRRQTGYAEANGTRFYREIEGTGDALVLMHAGIADHRMWDDQLHSFARRYRAIRYDARGYGRTAMGAGSYTLAEDLRGLLSALGIEQAILVACSQGGTAAIDFALEHPRMVTALILVSATPNGYSLGGEPPGKVLEFVSAYQRRDLPLAAELATQVWFDGPRRGPDHASPAVRDRVRDMVADVLAAPSIDLTGERFSSRPAVDRLAEIRAPTLVVVGDEDDRIVLEAGELMASRIPDAVKATIAGAAHLPSVDRPEEFNRVVLGFLAKTPGAA